MQRHLDRAIGALVGIVLFIAAYDLAARTARHQPRHVGQQITVAP